jgi:hypothetical protein
MSSVLQLFLVDAFQPVQAVGQMPRSAEVGGMPRLAAQLRRICESPCRQSWTPLIDGVTRCRLGPERNGAKGRQNVSTCSDAARSRQGSRARGGGEHVGIDVERVSDDRHRQGSGCPERAHWCPGAGGRDGPPRLGRAPEAGERTQSGASAGKPDTSGRAQFQPNRSDGGGRGWLSPGGWWCDSSAAFGPARS